jgi:hypothetical protein
MTGRRIRSRGVICACGLLVLTACNGGSASEETAPVPTRVSATTIDPADPTVTEAPSTVVVGKRIPTR